MGFLWASEEAECFGPLRHSAALLNSTEPNKRHTGPATLLMTILHGSGSVFKLLTHCTTEQRFII